MMVLCSSLHITLYASIVGCRSMQGVFYFSKRLQLASWVTFRSSVRFL